VGCKAIILVVIVVGARGGKDLARDVKSTLSFYNTHEMGEGEARTVMVP